MSKKVIVIGGGISGLSCAYALMKNGADVTIYEKNERAGGCIRTGSEDGYLFEYGPNTTMNSNDEIDQLCRDLGLEGERIFGNENSKRRYVVKNGKPLALPSGLSSFLTTPLWSLGGKLRLFWEPFVGRTKEEDESIADFVSRRIGQEFFDYALDPFVSGVYAGDPEKLSLKSTFPKMEALEKEHGSLILGAIKKGFSGGKKSSRQKGIFSFKEGMETLPKAIVKSLGDRYQGGIEVKEVLKKELGYVVHLAGGTAVDADEVILSAPAYVNANILSDLVPEASKELAAIDYAPIAVVYLGFRREDVEHSLDGFGCLIPKKEEKKLLGSLWNAAMFPGRVSEGMVCMSNFIGGARNREIVDQSDEAVLADVMRDLEDIFGVRGEPVFKIIIRYQRAIPQYMIGHSERLKKIDAALAPFEGIHLLGNFLQGVSVADCVMNGIKLARKIQPSN